MGKKIFYDDALKLGRTKEKESIYARHNKYGYKINVNHPQIRPLYERYKRHIKAIILSDAERFEFERLGLLMIKKKKKGEQ